MSASIRALVPELQPFVEIFIQVLGAAGLQPRITSTYRSRAEQSRLRRRYEAGLQPYFVALPGHSAHEYGLAFDLVVTPLSALAAAGELWESWGGRWGGRGRHGHPDPVHFEYPY